MINHITQYTQRGWAVFPCARNGKKPLTPNGFHDACSDTQQAIALFTHYDAAANLGIATGHVSGFFVVDVDIKDGAAGEESLRGLEAQYGALPKTVEALTWSGGRHILFKHPEGGVGNRTNMRPGIDVRGDGGYIVAAPSVIDGKAYDWEAAHHPDEVAIADAPAWLLTIVRGDPMPVEQIPETKTGAEAATGEKNTEGNSEKYTAGSRNDKLFRKAVALRKLGLPLDIIIGALQTINREMCQPPLTDKEVNNIARSAARYKPEQPKPINFAKEPYTDVWNAKMFYDHHGAEICYCDALGGWYIWDGTRWVKDDFKIMARAKNTIKHMYEIAAENKDTELHKHAVHSEAESKLRSMVNLVRDHKGISRKSSGFDDNQYLINCLNGTLDLRTGALAPHSKGDYITKRIELAYNAQAQCPTWEKFISDIFMANADTIKFVHKAIGYALTGSIDEQCLFILYGVGSNGKSTFLETIAAVLGDYAMSTLSSTIMEKNNAGIPNDVARLKGARFVNALETEENKRLAESVIKTLTGGDKIVARFLNKEFFEFYATFKIFLATNHKPRISGTDNGIWRRIRYIPFRRIITPAERDRSLPERLLAEREGILAWAIKGCKLWLTEGLGSCADIDVATEEYRQESDILQDFIYDCCRVDDGESVQASALYRCMADWCKNNGLFRLPRQKLIEYLEAKKITKKMLSFGTQKGSMFWYGIGLKYGGETSLQTSLPGQVSLPDEGGERPW